MAFFEPVVIAVREKPVMCYTDETVAKNVYKSPVSFAVDQVTRIVSSQHIPDSEYCIAFVWLDDGDVMVDLWLFSKLESWGSGPLADVKIFRNGKPETAIGVASGNTLLVLGLEERHRRECGSFDAYLKIRPVLPEELRKN